jgi:hypothetical protein
MRTLSWLLSGLLLLVPVAQTAQGSPQTNKQGPTIEEIKSKVVRLGVGTKAKATIKLKDGTKTKGYIYKAGEDDFVIRDRKTDAPTTIRYGDVANVERDGGHSTAKHVTLGVAAGVGAFVAILLIIFSQLND